MLCNLSKHNTTYTIQIQTLRRCLRKTRRYRQKSKKVFPGLANSAPRLRQSSNQVRPAFGLVRRKRWQGGCRVAIVTSNEVDPAAPKYGRGPEGLESGANASCENVVVIALSADKARPNSWRMRPDIVQLARRRRVRQISPQTRCSNASFFSAPHSDWYQIVVLG